MAVMVKWYRCNPYLGCMYEITEKQALRKINSRWWAAVWDDYWQKFSDHSWYDILWVWVKKGVKRMNDEKIIKGIFIIVGIVGLVKFIIG